LRVAPNDGYRLLARLGRDCAGAVVILPEDERPDAESADSSVEWLDEAELTELIEQLPRRPLGIELKGRKLRLSLAGVQRKLALARERDRFGYPRGRIPSTDLIKPQYSDEFQDLAINEMFCMSVAADAGIPAARSELMALGGRTCLISHRFDRDGDAGDTIRIHQEDLCQALGISPNLKYQANGGPGFAEFRRLLERIGGRTDLPVMARAAVLTTCWETATPTARTSHYCLPPRAGTWRLSMTSSQLPSTTSTTTWRWRSATTSSRRRSRSRTGST
jgi:serine/threonine-protein kinase HipA